MMPICDAHGASRVPTLFRREACVRGTALTVQVLAQASGPLISAVLRDRSGGYQLSLACFVALSALSVVAALLARPPARPPLAATSSAAPIPRHP